MAKILGDSKQNFLEGDREDDLIKGFAGNDVVDAGPGFDDVRGGDGDDILYGGANGDLVQGGIGDDIVAGGTGSDILYGDNLDGSGGVSTDVTTSRTKTIAETGQDLTVSLTAPDASSETSIDISGFVSAGAISNTSKVNIALVVDISGSTGSGYSGTPVGDVNADGYADQILDAEIAGSIALLKSIIKDAGFPDANVSLIPFGSYASITLEGRADMDKDNNGVRDFNEALMALRHTGGTDYIAALDEAIGFFNGAPSGSNHVFFLSDGVPNSSAFSTQVDTLLDPNGINANIQAFPIGSGASVSALDLLDDGVSNSSVTPITDPGALSASITGGGVTAADVKVLRILVDGKVVKTIAGADLIQTPLGLKYEVTLKNLSATDAETIQVIAVASDGSATAVGTSQVVEVMSSDGNDVMFGDGGSDKMFGQGGNDTMFGGEADDKLNGGDGKDRLFGNDGDDTLLGKAGADRIRGGEGNDTIAGGTENDRLYGGQGDDDVGGGDGNDLMYGRAGNDALDGGDGDDIMSGGAGEDVLLGGNGADTMNGGIDDDVLKGGKGRDTLLGKDGADTLYGEAGNDTLKGGNGKDRLRGDSGDDTLNGGDGADTFVFSDGHDQDVITDFVDNKDLLSLNDNLWTGTLNNANVISTYATVVGNDTVFDFGGGDTLTVEGITNKWDLQDDLAIF